jgi:hypothetical protein
MFVTASDMARLRSRLDDVGGKSLVMSAGSLLSMGTIHTHVCGQV